MKFRPLEPGDTEELDPDAASLGKYDIEKKIGVGGMAEIYLARLKADPSAYFAIKKILPQFTSDEHLIAMLVNEAKVMHSLRHPNIVPLYDFGRDSSSYYLAMEFVRGHDLKQIINRCRKAGLFIPVKLVLYIMMEFLDGLAYAHKRRDNFNRPLEIIHRDISPQNIMISNQGEIKILDFGIAKISGGISRTQTGMLKGKFSYMSPEQASGQKLDWRTDIFSAGIVMYELLTLENPFSADSEIRILENIKRSIYPEPRRFNPGLSKSIEKMLAKALARKISRRYHWAEQWQEAIYKLQKKEFGFASPAELKGFLDGLLYGHKPQVQATEIAMTEPSRQYEFARKESTTEIQRVQQRRRRWLRLVARCLLVLAILGGGVYLWHYPPRGLIRLGYAGIQQGWTLTQQAWRWGKTSVHGLKQKAAAIVTPPTPTPSTPALPAASAKADNKDAVAKTPAVLPAAVPMRVDNLPIRFVGKAWQQLNQLPFSQHEQLRDQIIDLLRGHYKDKPWLEKNRTATVKLKPFTITYQITADGQGVEILSFIR